MHVASTSIKTAARKKPSARKRALEWSDVLRAVQASRDAILAAYRAAGFTPDDFRLRPPREYMADLLTRAEDGLEGKHGARQTEERVAIRAVRKALELELWP